MPEQRQMDPSFTRSHSSSTHPTPSMPNAVSGSVSGRLPQAPTSESGTITGAGQAARLALGVMTTEKPGRHSLSDHVTQPSTLSATPGLGFLGLAVSSGSAPPGQLSVETPGAQHSVVGENEPPNSLLFSQGHRPIPPSLPVTPTSTHDSIYASAFTDRLRPLQSENTSDGQERVTSMASSLVHGIDDFPSLSQLSTRPPPATSSSTSSTGTSNTALSSQNASPSAVNAPHVSAFSTATRPMSDVSIFSTDSPSAASIQLSRRVGVNTSMLVTSFADLQAQPQLTGVSLQHDHVTRAEAIYHQEHLERPTSSEVLLFAQPLRESVAVPPSAPIRPIQAPVTTSNPSLNDTLPASPGRGSNSFETLNTDRETIYHTPRTTTSGRSLTSETEDPSSLATPPVPSTTTNEPTPGPHPYAAAPEPRSRFSDDSGEPVVDNTRLSAIEEVEYGSSPPTSPTPSESDYPSGRTMASEELVSLGTGSTPSALPGFSEDVFLSAAMSQVAPEKKKWWKLASTKGKEKEGEEGEGEGERERQKGKGRQKEKERQKERERERGKQKGKERQKEREKSKDKDKGEGKDIEDKPKSHWTKILIPALGAPKSSSREQSTSSSPVIPQPGGAHINGPSLDVPRQHLRQSKSDALIGNNRKAFVIERGDSESAALGGPPRFLEPPTTRAGHLAPLLEQGYWSEATFMYELLSSGILSLSSSTSGNTHLSRAIYIADRILEHILSPSFGPPQDDRANDEMGGELEYI